MPIPKRVSIRLDEDEILALIDAASEYLERSVPDLGAQNANLLDQAASRGQIFFAGVQGLKLDPDVIGQARTYFYLQLALTQLQADFDRLMTR